MRLKPNPRPAKKQKRKSRPVSLHAQHLALATGQDPKYFDTAITADAVSTGTIVQLTSIAAGTTALTRVGNKVMMKSATIRLALALEGVLNNINARFMLVVDRQPNAATFAIASLLEAPTVESMPAIINKSRFKILWDHVVTANDFGGASVTKAFIKHFVKIPEECNLTTYFDGTAAIPTTNSLVLVYLSDTAAGTTDLDVAGVVRICANG